MADKFVVILIVCLINWSLAEISGTTEEITAVTGREVSLINSTIKTEVGLTDGLNNEDDLDNWIDPEEMRRNYPYVLAGYDHEKRPVWIVEAGRLNFRKITEQGQQAIAEFDRYVHKAFNRFAQSIRQQSTPEEPVTGMIFIVDLDGFSFNQLVHVPTVSLLLKIVREHVKWFAKNLELMLIVNTNAVAHTLVNMGRPILGRVMERIEVFGTQRPNWQPRILQHVPRDQLPEFYGGIKDFKPVQIYG